MPTSLPTPLARQAILALAWLLLASVPAAEVGAAEPVDYLTQIKPIFRERCFACHGALKQEGELRLDSAASIRKGGDSGGAIEPDRALTSLLIERVEADEDDGRMPPEGKPLTAEEIELLKSWIDSGATAPKDDRPEEDPSNHWAFQSPTKSALPRPLDPLWRDNPVDAFIAAQRESLGLKPTPLVDRRLLLRRVYLDLIGLPPTRAQMQAFLNDSREDAYERVVDELLESLHYGERWGRHWMDVWRYADWAGLGAQLRYSQKHIWHWRDWIVESLNDDKGYDSMLLEMLAADEIAPTDRDKLRATGFLARNYFLFNRTTWLDNTIEHTSKAFLGLTMNCTKCHDHKYDPFSQVDYYRLRAFFEPHQVRLDSVPGQTDLEKDGLPRVFDAHPDEPTYVHVRGDASNPDKTAAIDPGVPDILAWNALKIRSIQLPPAAHRPEIQTFVLDDLLDSAAAQIAAAEKSVEARRRQLASLETKAKTEQADSTPSRAQSEPGKPFLVDEFDALGKEHWEIGPGQWKAADGRLIQSQIGASRAYLKSKREHPADFEAVLKFRTTGGEKWKSVGLAFDVGGDHEKLVYLSAVAPGSKLQISYKVGAKQNYPADGLVGMPVALDTDYEIRIRVRKKLVNVALNGRHVLAYSLPIARSPGRFELVAFDAAVEFDSLRSQTLSGATKLVETKGKVTKSNEPLTVEQAKLAAIIADRVLASARARTDAIRTAHIANVEKAKQSEDKSLKPLIGAAALAARNFELTEAEHKLALAEQGLLNSAPATKKKAEKTVADAKAARAKANEACKKPGDGYYLIRASQKALEGPDEKSPSRFAPYPKESTGRRTALARWIIDSKNPLTARVAVNHICMRHFGQPIVDSVTDFGRRAPRPAQLKLLDWLAVDLMEHKWSMKRLHRLLVTSQTYRLSTSTATVDAETMKADPDNAYYWRRLPMRMQSQLVRDSLLQLAGVLNPTVGGPTIDPSKADTANRRSIYFTHSRDDRSKFLTMFDDADILRCYRRDESIVPQQALTLANSKQSILLSRELAKRLQSELGEVDDKTFVVEAFRLILAIEPTDAETAACLDAVSRTKQVLLAAKHASPASRARADLVHALINHNYFVTIR